MFFAWLLLCLEGSLLLSISSWDPLCIFGSLVESFVGFSKCACFFFAFLCSCSPGWVAQPLKGWEDQNVEWWLDTTHKCCLKTEQKQKKFAFRGTYSTLTEESLLDDVIFFSSFRFFLGRVLSSSSTWKLPNAGLNTNRTPDRWKYVNCIQKPNIPNSWLVCCFKSAHGLR